MPAWKLGKDLLCDRDSSTHAGAKLVYMGDSRFCLVACRKAKDYASNPSLRAMDMASFVIKYNKDGDLRTAKHWAHGSMSTVVLVPDGA
ncbi:hypothetical protein PAHAL_7G280100 [Panicum hallii]|jgi:hypothetical protein|uniref:Uncharacterized protein n=1 Tax=Panicum hallii TaxID=206008 RepID=A0A2T8IDQ9_9POAL|nr:hypothetical protein PAHAL_7G280100 [Panicum hallii]